MCVCLCVYIYLRVQQSSCQNNNNNSINRDIPRIYQHPRVYTAKRVVPTESVLESKITARNAVFSFSSTRGRWYFSIRHGWRPRQRAWTFSVRNFASRDLNTNPETHTHTVYAGSSEKRPADVRVDLNYWPDGANACHTILRRHRRST